MKDIIIGKRYYWSFRHMKNVAVFPLYRDQHRPEFVYCEEDITGRKICAEDIDLSEEKK